MQWLQFCQVTTPTRVERRRGAGAGAGHKKRLWLCVCACVGKIMGGGDETSNSDVAFLTSVGGSWMPGVRLLRPQGVGTRW